MASLTKGSPLFRWTISGFRPDKQTSYSLRVVEVNQGDTLSDALRTKRPIVEANRLNSLSFQATEKSAFATGKVYAAQVTAIGPGGRVLAHSDPSFFSINSWPSFCFLLGTSSTLDFCVGQSFTLAYVVSTSGGSYNWSLTGAGTASGSGSGAIVVPAGAISSSGSYNLTVTPTSSGGCAPGPAYFQLTAHQPVNAGTITVSPATALCPGDAAVLTLTGQSGDVQWYNSTSAGTVFSNPLLGSTNNTVLNTNNLSQTTYYGVMVSPSDGGPCPPVQSQVVAVQVKPVPTTPVISGPSFICVGGNATIHVTTSSGAGSYQWIYNGIPLGPATTTAPTSLAITNAGNYALEFNDGCTTVSSNVVSVQLDSLGVLINGPCCVHPHDPITLTAVASGGSGTYTSFVWNTAPVQNGGQAHYTAQGTMTYSVTVTDSNNCQATASFTVTVCP
jgi:hypothetical protein